MSLQTVTVSVKRATRAKSAVGGKSVTWETVLTGIECTQTYYSRRSVTRIESGGGQSAGGPGAARRDEELFVFESDPLPDIRAEDRIVTEDGLEYSVLTRPRVYEGPMLQVDTEIVR